MHTMSRPSLARWRAGLTIQLYVLRLTVRPFFGTLLIVLPALLLERLLRLFDLMAADSVPADTIAGLLADLVPHYLGQALPPCLFVGIYAVVARLSAAHELDAMQGAGLSLAWISRPFILIGAVLGLVAFGVYGYLEPLSRYAYRVGLQIATDGSWDAQLPAGQITQITPDLVVEADRAGPGGALSRVFIYQRQAGGEMVTTGRTAQLHLAPGGHDVLLQVADGARLQVEPDGRIATLTAPDTISAQPFTLALPRLPARGLDDRELTLGELWQAHDQAPAAARRVAAELHSRIVLALSLVVIPFMAVPFGLAAPRANRAYGIVAGALILVLFLHAVQLAASMGSAGLVDPRPLLWLIFIVFTLFSLALFRAAHRHTHQVPLAGLFAYLHAAATRRRRHTG
jgi:lipopolysaccharide export system permease protein